MARMQTLRLDGFLLRPLLSLFSALVLCGLLMLFGLTTRGTIEVGYCTHLSATLVALTNR